MRAWLSWCCLQLDDVFFPKHTIIGWRFFSLSTLMLQKWCTHSMGYACISLDDVSYRSSMFLSRCAQTISNAWIVLLMKPVIGRHYLDNAYKSKTWCWVDAHTPWLIRVGLGCRRLPLADVSWSMCGGHNLCHHALLNATCFIRDGHMPHLCMQASLMFHVIRLHRF